jgi:phosphatidylserine/phosphatidylglycerophosphate/cardiolipin synthase-like enzyme
MRNQSLTIDILADELHSLLYSNSESDEIIHLLKNTLPSLSHEDAVKTLQIIKAISASQNDESVEIVTTTPVSFQIKTRKTKPVIIELLSEAKKSILLTGYSISDHFEEMLKLINNKSKQGVVVELFVNKYENIRSLLSDIKHTNRRFFKVYEYSGNEDDKMASLHAKTIVIDNMKMLISSANLSFHGLEGNIEIGTLVISKEKAELIQEIFSDLKRRGLFNLIEKDYYNPSI